MMQEGEEEQEEAEEEATNNKCVWSWYEVK